MITGACNAFVEGLTTNSFTGIDIFVTLLLATALGATCGWMWREIKEWDKEKEAAMNL